MNYKNVTFHFLLFYSAFLLLDFFSKSFNAEIFNFLFIFKVIKKLAFSYLNLKSVIFFYFMVRLFLTLIFVDNESHMILDQFHDLISYLTIVKFKTQMPFQKLL
jgi:hypothetical protein